MDWKFKCAALIPCFNEAANIGRVVATIKPLVPAVIVVDDGSSDGTARVAEAAGAEVLTLATNRGKGAALRAGWARARARNFEWVLMLDGDGQHAAGDIPGFFECAERTGSAMVVGKRDFNGIPLLRRLVNRMMSLELSRLTGRDLPDSQCGFRLVELGALMNLPLVGDHFEIESELLVAFARARQRIEFVPVQTIYQNGTSKIRPFQDTVRWLRWRLAQSKSNSPHIFLAPDVASKTSFAD